MEYLQQLLQQYNSGKASEAERQELLALLEKQGRTLQQAMHEAFGDGLDTNEPLLPADRAELILQKMHAQIHAAGSGVVRGTVTRMFRKAMVAVAAVFILLIAGRHWIHNGNKEKTGTIAFAEKDTTEPLQLIKNNTAKKETLLLPDSSVVELSPGSVLSYAKQFHSLYRSLYLQGEACFNVAKDTKRPFTVYANGIATTALGTRFSVSTFYKDEQVRVRLIEGKVVVRMQENPLAMKPVYLTPGQECMINRIKGEALVQSFGLSAARKTEMVARATPGATASSLNFERESLQNVFKQIEKIYKVSIVYRGVAIGGLSFTGTFLPTDTLPVVLSVICKTNDLAFEQKDNLITITSLP